MLVIVENDMVNSFYLGFSVIFPIFLMMGIGYCLRKIGFLKDEFLMQLNQLSFKVFIPILLFDNVYSSNFKEEFNPELSIFAIVCVLVSFIVMMVIVPIFEKDNTRRGVLVQGMFRSNYILFGLPVSIALFGKELAGTTAILVALVVPLFNFLSVIALETWRNKQTDSQNVPQKGNLLGIIRGVLTNPLIIGAIIGFFFVLSGLRLPSVIETTIHQVSDVATPLSLIILGGYFTFSKLKPNLKPLSMAVLGRLVLIPMVFLPIAIVFGYRGIALGSLMTMLASPTAVSSFTMADQMGGDSELAGQIVVVGSLSSVFTIFLWISALNAFGLLTV